MHLARQDLKLDRLLVVYPSGWASFGLSDWADAVAIRDLDARLEALRMPAVHTRR